MYSFYTCQTFVIAKLTLEHLIRTHIFGIRVTNTVKKARKFYTDNCNILSYEGSDGYNNNISLGYQNTDF